MLGFKVWEEEKGLWERQKGKAGILGRWVGVECKEKVIGGGGEERWWWRRR